MMIFDAFWPHRVALNKQWFYALCDIFHSNS